MPKSPLVTLAGLAAGLLLAACGTHAAPAGQTGVQTGADAAAPAPKGRMCGGIAAIACEPGDYCRMKPPFHPDQSGVCVSKPEMCNMLFQPVCGTDGKTYPNSCHAERAGVNVAKEGACAK